MPHDNEVLKKLENAADDIIDWCDAHPGKTPPAWMRIRLREADESSSKSWFWKNYRERHRKKH